jgi:hypothetical protein
VTVAVGAVDVPDGVNPSLIFEMGVDGDIRASASRLRLISRFARGILAATFTVDGTMPSTTAEPVTVKPLGAAQVSGVPDGGCATVNEIV